MSTSGGSKGGEGGISQAEVEVIANEAEEDAVAASLPRTTFAFHAEDAKGNLIVGSAPAELTGEKNTAVGAGAGASLTIGISNNAVGFNAQHSLTTASFNNCIGREAQIAATTAENCNVVGDIAQTKLTSGTDNNGVGDAIQSGVTSGKHNNCVGGRAQNKLAAASFNVAIGGEAQHGLTSIAATLGVITGGSGYTPGEYSVEMTKVSGPMSLSPKAKITVGAEGKVTAVVLTGGGSGVDLTTVLSAEIGETGSGFSVPVATITSGNNNVAIGHQAGFSSSTGSGCVFIGFQAGKKETASNKLYISNSETATPLILGEFPNESLQFNATRMGFFKATPVTKPEKPAETVKAIIELLEKLGLCA